jgi:hypothetical protein
MTCKNARAISIERSRSGEPRSSADPDSRAMRRATRHAAHLEACAACARFLEAQVALRSAFASLALEAPPAPAALESSLLAEFDAAQLRPGAARRFRWWLPTATAAALAAVAAAALAIHRPVAAPGPTGQPFVEIPYTAPLAPYDRTNIVRMEVPVAALIAAGFEVRATDAGAALTADVLVGQDGRAHAIRLLSNSAAYFN